MKITLKELRRTIAENLLTEALGGYSMVKLEAPDDEPTRWVLIKGDKPVAGVETEGVKQGFHRINTLWGSSSTATYAILMTVLYELDGVVPDELVSPAAQSVIKRWYDAHEGDPAYIIDNAIPGKGEKYLHAAYLAGPDVKSYVSDVKDVSFQSDEWWKWRAANATNFGAAYRDPKRTGSEDTIGTYAKSNNWAAVIRLLVSKIESSEESAQEAEKWMTANFDTIKKAAARGKLDPKEWNAKIVDFDDLQHFKI